jgi:hypothetical protein
MENLMDALKREIERNKELMVPPSKSDPWETSLAKPSGSMLTEGRKTPSHPATL